MIFIDFKLKILKNWFFNAIMHFKCKKCIINENFFKNSKVYRIWKYWWNFYDDNILLRVI